MKHVNLSKLAFAIVAVLILNLIAVFGIYADDQYSFKVNNTTKDVIKQLLVSEDNKTWGHFDIGEGIKPGVSETLLWDKSTNNQDCKQYIKAVFEDGSETEPVIFDFCEKGLELEF